MVLSAACWVLPGMVGGGLRASIVLYAGGGFGLGPRIVDWTKASPEESGIDDNGLRFWGVDFGEHFGLLKGVVVGATGDGGGGVLGNFGDHIGCVHAEACLFRVLGGDEESAHDEAGAVDFDVVADEGVDDFHERGLDGLGIFKHGNGMEARLGRGADAADEALLKITKHFVTQGR